MIRGRILHFETGKPVVGAFVWYGYEPGQYVVSDKDGYFSVNVAPFTVLEIVATGKQPIKNVLGSDIQGQDVLMQNSSSFEEGGTLEDGTYMNVYRKKPCVWCWIVGLTVAGVTAYHLFDNSNSPTKVKV